MTWRAYALMGGGFLTLGVALYYLYRQLTKPPPDWPQIKLTRTCLVEYWPPEADRRMRVALLRPDPPRPKRWIAGIYEVPVADFAQFPRTYDPNKDAYYYDDEPWEWYEHIFWHLLVETEHEHVLTDIYPSRKGWVLVLDTMWYEHTWWCGWPLYAVSGDGIIG